MTSIVFLCILVGLALILALGSIILALSVTPAALSRDVKMVRLEFNDLFDQVDHFMKRDRTRKSREYAAPAEEPALVDKKTELRRRAGIG